MWTYKQSTGDLFFNGKYIATGYSGREWAKNNPDAEVAKAMGPIPRGKWRITEKYDSARVGPYALVLHAIDATPENDTHDLTGRGAFRIHGDSVRLPGTASHGCIILARLVRQQIWQSNDHILEVVE